MGWIRLLRIAIVCISLLAIAEHTRAQTWSEWFSQKKTQKKYLIEQMAALKLYAGYLKKGYEIGSSGLGFLKGATRGEFDLHSTFFSSLKMVSPAVRKDVRIAEILAMQLLVGKAFSRLDDVDGLAIESMGYIDLVKKDLLSECLNDLEELLLVITSGKIEMGDDERITRVDHIYRSMQSKKIFALQFLGVAKSLAAERNSELKSLKEMEVRYENKSH